MARGDRETTMHCFALQKMCRNGPHRSNKLKVSSCRDVLAASSRSRWPVQDC